VNFEQVRREAAYDLPYDEGLLYLDGSDDAVEGVRRSVAT